MKQWWRFANDRRKSYLARIAGEPSAWQEDTIESLVRLEWSALRREAERALIIGREARETARAARENRRLFQRILGDFERSIPKPAPKQEPSLADIVADIVAREARE